MENSTTFPKKNKNRLLYDPAIALLGIYPKEVKPRSQRDISSLVFTAALFTKVKMWKQPKCGSMCESIKNVVYTYNRILYSFKNEKNSDTCYNMNERTIMLSEISKTQKNKHYITTVI